MTECGNHTGGVSLAMGAQIVDASIMEAPEQRNTWEEKIGIKAGRILEGKVKRTSCGRRVWMRAGR